MNSDPRLPTQRKPSSLAARRYAADFEKQLAQVFGTKLSKLTVSGSAANLLALIALTFLETGKARIEPGAEVITVAAGFPATVAPILQNGCIPVYADVDLATHNVDVDLIEAAISSKTRDHDRAQPGQSL